MQWEHRMRPHLARGSGARAAHAQCAVGTMPAGPRWPKQGWGEGQGREKRTPIVRVHSPMGGEPAGPKASRAEGTPLSLRPLDLTDWQEETRGEGASDQLRWSEPDLVSFGEVRRQGEPLSGTRMVSRGPGQDPVLSWDVTFTAHGLPGNIDEAGCAEVSRDINQEARDHRGSRA